MDRKRHLGIRRSSFLLLDVCDDSTYSFLGINILIDLWINILIEAEINILRSQNANCMH